MNLSGVGYLGSRYLLEHRARAVILITAIALNIFLPLAISLVVVKAESYLRARSASTPLLLGAVGSPLELVFNGLYFSEPDVATFPLSTARATAADGLATTIPLYARYEARGHTIVGTTVEYFGFRDLRFRNGRSFGRVGDCVLGASVANALDLAAGDSIVSTPEQVFDLAGVYPLKMRITGILAPTGGPDDDVIFADIKTAWIIEGIGHGHQDVVDQRDGVLGVDEGNVKLNASVLQYAEITDDNIGTFHLHGDEADLPISAAIVRPADARARTILLGRFVGDRSTAQLIGPDAVMAELFATVFRIRDVVIAALIAVGATAIAIAAIVFLLSNRLRAREFQSLAVIGADATNVRLLVLFEATFVVVSGSLVAAALLTMLSAAIPSLLPMLT